MKIKKITIRNLRGIDNLELNLTGPDDQPLDLVMLAGPNGCGKTTVLEAGLWALKQDKLVLRKPPDQPFEITVEAVRNGQDATLSLEPGLHQVTLTGGQASRKVADYVKGVQCFYFSSWRTPRLVGGVGLSSGKGRRPDRNENNTLLRFKSRMVTLKASESFESANPSSSEEPDADNLLRHLSEAWRYFYPERNGRFDTRKLPPTREQIESDEDVETKFDVFLTDEKRPNGVAVDDLSSGEIEILSMLGMFISEYRPYDIVFIDEPELHLHPAWHRSILPALRKVAPNTQLICATHSGEILESLYSFQRFTILDKDDPRVRMFHRAAGGEQ